MKTYYTYTGAYIRPNYTRDDKLDAMLRHYDDKRTTPCYLLFMNTVTGKTVSLSDVKVDKAVDYCEDDNTVVLEVIAVKKYKDEDEVVNSDADGSVLDEGGEDPGYN